MVRPLNLLFPPHPTPPSVRVVLEGSRLINPRITFLVSRSRPEFENRRRLVQFWRKQVGATIEVAYKPVDQLEWQKDTIVISCIWRLEKNECYVSSSPPTSALTGSRMLTFWFLSWMNDRSRLSIRSTCSRPSSATASRSRRRTESGATSRA